MLTRRKFLARTVAGAMAGTLAGSGVALAPPARAADAGAAPPRAARSGEGMSDAPKPSGAAPLHVRAIPASGEKLPVIGLGTSGTFDVEPAAATAGDVRQVYDAFVAGGGRVLDTSPMYGRSEAVLGALMAARGNRSEMFVATKVWTRGREAGARQIAESMRLLGTKRLDLVQIHNLLDWREHVPTLRRLKDEGALRYTGITHYTVASHAELRQVLEAEKFDFVQLNYSVATRDAERELLPFCRERGIAVLVNRAFEDGKLFQLTRGRPLPPWVAEFDCTSWAQFFLKYVVSHPAVTCVIPATSKPSNQLDNLRGGAGRLPDERLRARMVEAIAAL
jgi:diketogulonate reductase-like aldo/keto reductase